LDKSYFRARPRATAQSFPGFSFSDYRSIVFYAPILVSFEQFKFILDNYIKAQIAEGKE